MMSIDHLSVGDKITILYHGRKYPTVVQDMPAPDTLIVAQPTNLGVYLNLLADEEAEVLFMKENGVLTFNVAQEERFLAGDVPMLRLRAVTPVRRSQRRSYYRLPKSLPVQLSVKSEEQPKEEALTIKARTINISGGGCRIAIRQLLDNDSKLECKITLAPNMELVLDGQVVWVEKHSGEETTNVIGVQFIDEDSAMQKKLVTYVTNEQRKQLKSGR